MQKFRLWDKENKVMIPWEQYKHEMVGSDFENDLLVVMPYTGEKDRNGAEIWDEDIVKVRDDWEIYGWMAGAIRKVYFNAGGFRLKSNKRDDRGCWLEDGEDFEVIGNIYENPELLEAYKNEN